MVSAENFYLAPTGNDANPGTLAKPFSTLQRAQKAARQAAASGAVSVFFREGTYYLPEILVFTAEDSGRKDAPVIYQGYEKEQAVVSGGVKLVGLNWKPYRDGIMQAAMPADFYTDQLFLNGEGLPMARYPDFNPNERVFNGHAADAFSPERAAKWKDPAGGFIHALHGGEWGGMHYLITGKGPDHKIAYEGGWQNNRRMGMNARRFVENIFEELDAPGEWFLDSRTHILYLFPPPGVDLAKATVEAVRLRHLIEFRGTEQAPVRFVGVKGLSFRHAARTFMDTKEPLLRSDWTIYRGGAVFVNGAEDCLIENCLIDRIGGNAVFVNNYNRRITVRGCHITHAGGSGVALIGDPKAVFNPLFEYGQRQNFDKIDMTPGPKTSNYPADCVVEDCLIHETGKIEKQSAGVTMDMSQGITVRHCSVYDVPRAGINIGDGCWGGHLIEFCDVFDTVKETGDHGSFNSWGRDRFWGLGGLDLNSDTVWETHKNIVLLDAVKTIIIRNSRWRCDHGWDIDLDDGSSNFHIYNNLCLRGGLKNREGFFRVVENNILIGGFHPHVWYKHSEDVVRRNIMFSDHYLPAGGMPDTPWGKEMDFNFVHSPGAAEPQPAIKLAGQSKRDQHSILADALFINAVEGDYRVKEGSPALKLGFVNFPMDRFGVQKPELKSLARTPELPGAKSLGKGPAKGRPATRPSFVWQAWMRDISGLGDRSAYGLPDESGVLVLSAPAASVAATAVLQKDDVIRACNGQAVRNLENLLKQRDKAAGRKLDVSIIRKQKELSVEIGDYAYAVTEAVESPDFKNITISPDPMVVPAKVSAGGAPTNNDPIESLVDGRITPGFGPVFANGVENGMYKLDLSASKIIARINTFTGGSHRARQNFVIYASNSAADPGWKITDPALFTPLIAVDSRQGVPSANEATSIRRSGDQPLGTYRWLVWAVSPVTDAAENTSFHELQVIPAK